MTKKDVRIKIPLAYLDQSPDTLEDFLRIKQTYVNGIIYTTKKHIIKSRLRSNGLNYTERRLSVLFDLWIKLGWVTEINGCYHFASNKNKVYRSVQATDLRHEIRKHQITNNLRRQKFAMETKRNIKYPSNHADYKSAKKRIKLLTCDTSKFYLDLMLAYRTIGSMLNISPSYAYKVMEKIISEGVISKTKAKSFKRTDNGFLKRTPNAYILLS